MFSQLRIWDTEQNNGVLIYLLLADRDVEIVADRGIDAAVGPDAWADDLPDDGSAVQGRAFRSRRGLRGIEAITAHLVEHFPKRGAADNELPDAPIVI